jgi:hypothetical protein
MFKSDQFIINIRYKGGYCIQTPLTLVGRGIKLHKKLDSIDAFSNEKIEGWNDYDVTETAFAKIKKQYGIDWRR